MTMKTLYVAIAMLIGLGMNILALDRTAWAARSPW